MTTDTELTLSTDKIIARISGATGHVIFNNPERHNAVSLEMWDAVEEALSAFVDDERVRVVILSGAGGKAFVSGADISKFEQERGSKDATAHYNARLKVVYDIIENYPKPTLAMIDGHCIGGGLNLAACTDMRIASAKSRFAMPAAKLALGYPFDAIRRLVNAVGAAAAKQMMFTAKSIDADTALRLGLVQEVVADGELAEIDYSDMTDYEVNPREGARAEVTQVQNDGWIGFTDHFWMSTLIPAPGTGFKSVSKYDDRRDIYQTEAVLPTQTIQDGQNVTITTQLFAGAKEWEAIRNYERAGILGFLDSIDWGWFFFLTKPIFWLLHEINKLVGNMGWAIIGLTLIIKAILFPLAYKSYVSMAKMKELQPEMEKLKEAAGDDRQKLQKGMMELYKKEKVNPAAGCLPILLQIPIFFSLYKVIFVTIELRHAPWFGPFQDLSAPDPTSIMNFFGLLPFQGPEPGSLIALIFIGILPLLLGISMWLQQKLNPAPTDPTQQMIFAWMPWVFMFMLGSFASGLVVY